MAVETEDDLLELLNVDEFAEEIILDPDSSAITIPAIFDAGFVTIDDGLLPVSSAETALTCRTSDVVSVIEGMIVVVQGDRYNVGDIQADGTGLTSLRIYLV